MKVLNAISSIVLTQVNGQVCAQLQYDIGTSDIPGMNQAETLQMNLSSADQTALQTLFTEATAQAKAAQGIS